MKVTIKELTVHYRDDDHSLLALDRVDLTLQPGRVTALVGESGSGKTTLGKALMGLLPDNAEIQGSVRMKDREIVGLDESSMNKLRWSATAMVFQNGAANLNPVYRLVDQVAEPLIQQYGENRAKAREAAENMLVRMGLSSEQGLRYPHELSGGQVQRGLLAMALILDPQVVILDEPTAALDAITKTFVADVVMDLRRAGKTILLITHDLGLAQSLADDLAVLYLGQVMEIMPAADLLDHPQHPYALALGRSFPDMDAVRDLGGIRGDAFYRLVHAHSRENGADHIHTHVAAPDAYHESGHAPPQGCLFRPRCTQAVKDCGMGDIALLDAGSHKVRCLRGGIVDLLELSGVEKSYGDVAALKPTDLILRAGEVFCLVGETGSGKTTLAGIAGGALEPDKGRRVFDGRDMDEWIKRDYSSLVPKVGIIYQNPAESVSHRFTVFDVAAEPLRIQNNGLSKEEIRERVFKALSEVRLSTAPEFLKKYPHELNMGAIQRLCLARALIHDPMLLIADEPTSALDPSVQAKVLKMLLGLQTEKGLTMLFVTHDIGLARKIGDRIGVMLAGNLVEIGPASQIISRPGHPYTKMLIDAARGRPVGPANGAGGAGTEPVGCPFAQRCYQCREQCGLEFPSPVNLDGGRHMAWCRFPLRDENENLHNHELHDGDSIASLKF